MMQAPAHPRRQQGVLPGDRPARERATQRARLSLGPGERQALRPGPGPAIPARTGPGPAPRAESLPPPPAARLGLELAPNAVRERGPRRVPGKGCCLPAPPSASAVRKSRVGPAGSGRGQRRGLGHPAGGGRRTNSARSLKVFRPEQAGGWGWEMGEPSAAAQAGGRGKDSTIGVSNGSPSTACLSVGVRGHPLLWVGVLSAACYCGWGGQVSVALKMGERDWLPCSPFQPSGERRCRPQYRRPKEGREGSESP